MQIGARQQGFTLVEIMVVVTIVGIVLSIAVLSIGTLGNRDELDTELRRFIALVDTARDDSMFQGREFGVEFLRQGYRFLELDPLTRQWLEIPGDDIFRPRNLPESVELELFIEGQQIELDFDAAVLDVEDERTEQFQPHVFLFSSGDMTAFELHFRRAYSDEVTVIEGNLLGELSVLEEELL